MSFLLPLGLLVLLTNKPTSGSTCKTNKCQPSLPPQSSSDGHGRKQKECAIVRSCVLARSLTSSRLYNTLINTYTVGWYNRIIRLLLVFYVRYPSKVTYSKGCCGRFLWSFPSIRPVIHPWMASYKEENPGGNK